MPLANVVCEKAIVGFQMVYFVSRKVNTYIRVPIVCIVSVKVAVSVPMVYVVSGKVDVSVPMVYFCVREC